jgi:transcriptional regulator with XRE-family HTH domain
VLTAAQMKAARSLLGMEQKTLAELSGVSLPTIQRMEASNGVVRGVIETLMKVMGALETAGIEFINEGAASGGGGRGVRLRRSNNP